MNLVSVKAEEKGLEIRQEFDQDIPGRLYGDELRIKQILINVLNNAIKYTDKGNDHIWAVRGNRQSRIACC